MTRTPRFDRLAGADLIGNHVEQGGDLLSRLPVGHQGGFRTHGRTVRDTVKLVMLFPSGAEPDWPDALDPYTGTITYFGDDGLPGRDLRDTLKKDLRRARGRPLMTVVFRLFWHVCGTPSRVGPLCRPRSAPFSAVTGTFRVRFGETMDAHQFRFPFPFKISSGTPLGILRDTLYK
jgi:hypothetical protein